MLPGRHRLLGRVFVAYLASTVALSFSIVSPVVLFVALCLTVTVTTGWNCVFEDLKGPGSKAIRHCRKECVNRASVCKQDQDTVNVIGFLGLVGKEPDVARGLLVDTGASSTSTVKIVLSSLRELFSDRGNCGVLNSKLKALLLLALKVVQ